MGLAVNRGFGLVRNPRIDWSKAPDFLLLVLLDTVDVDEKKTTPTTIHKAQTHTQKSKKQGNKQNNKQQ